NGTDLAARQAMLLGAFLAGQAFANAPVAAVHALAYPLGGHFHIPHGLSNSLVLPHVMRFNLSACHAHYAELAPIIMGAEFIPHSSSEAVASELVKYIERLIGRLKLPTHLRDMNIAEQDLPMLAADAMLQERLLINNPREVNEADALEVYRAAF
ncbi:MAG: iron-containing alcohol dehydrogenase, partial [Cellvibrionaceae bacterium]|nr:iron-containing alcohol dehydrogenase [Cellvibrionaceae bacterium]